MSSTNDLKTGLDQLVRLFSQNGTEPGWWRLDCEIGEPVQPSSAPPVHPLFYQPNLPLSFFPKMLGLGLLFGPGWPPHDLHITFMPLMEFKQLYILIGFRCGMHLQKFQNGFPINRIEPWSERLRSRGWPLGANYSLWYKLASCYKIK